MDALTTAVRDALVAEGASPALADQLATEHVYQFRRHIKREHDTNEAQRLLPLIGAAAAAEKLNVCRATIYNRQKPRRKSNSDGTVRQQPRSVGTTG
jgi:hypothetical protein